MESELALKDKGRYYDYVVEIQNQGAEGTSRKRADLQENGVLESKEDLTRVQMNSVPPPDFSAKPPLGPAIRRRLIAQSAYCKPKSRIVEPPHTTIPKPVEENPQPATAKSPHKLSPKVASPSVKSNPGTPKTSAPITPRTPLMASTGEDDDEDNDDKVYEIEPLKNLKAKHGKKVRFMILIEWIAFVSIISVLVTSLTVNKLKGFKIWDLKLWRWCVLISVIFCGRLFTGWFTNTLVFLIEKNFLLKKKVLYFLFGLKKIFRVVIWLALILLIWGLLINRGVKRSEDATKRSEDATKIRNHITRGIVSTLVGAVLWMGKTLLVKLVASKFHVRTYFDRIQESIFHQYILEALSRAPTVESDAISCQLSFNSVKTGKQEKGEVINVDKLYKIRREKVSAWTMGGLIKVIRNSGLTTVSEVIDDSVEEERGESKEIMSEVEARDAAKRIFRNVAKHGHKYIGEDDLLRFMPKEEVDNAFPLFEGAAETRRITKSSFRNWVVNAYNERKYLAVSLTDAKTAIEELNKIASGMILVVIIIVWLLLMEITTNKVLVFISSQVLLVVFMFGNTVKMVFEAMIFVFVMHPFDVGDRCVVDGVQMVVDEMNILTTIFLKPDNEKVYYPNSILSTKPISNFNRSPDMGDAVEFAVDFSTSVEKIADMKAKIKAYLESKPQQWRPSHSVQLKEIVDVHKMNMALYVSHTMNFQNSGKGGIADLISFSNLREYWRRSVLRTDSFLRKCRSAMSEQQLQHKTVLIH